MCPQVYRILPYSITGEETGLQAMDTGSAVTKSSRGM